MSRTLRPFFSFFGGKWKLATRYPAPSRPLIVEPFAGSAGYATRYADRDVVLVDRDPTIAAIWRWLITVSVDEVMSLPLDPSDRSSLHRAPRDLIGFWCARGRTRPANTTSSAWLRSGKWPASFWGEYARARIAEQVPLIRHWRIIEGDYTEAPDVDATWFVDPPYIGSRRYPARVEDYAHLASWTRSRRGQVIACEQSGATWLPFSKFRRTTNISRGTTVEAIWVGP